MKSSNSAEKSSKNLLKWRITSFGLRTDDIRPRNQRWWKIIYALPAILVVQCWRRSFYPPTSYIFFDCSHVELNTASEHFIIEMVNKKGGKNRKGPRGGTAGPSSSATESGPCALHSRLLQLHAGFDAVWMAVRSKGGKTADGIMQAAAGMDRKSFKTQLWGLKSH